MVNTYSNWWNCSQVRWKTKKGTKESHFKKSDLNIATNEGKKASGNKTRTKRQMKQRAEYLRDMTRWKDINPSTKMLVFIKADCPISSLQTVTL